VAAATPFVFSPMSSSAWSTRRVVGEVMEMTKLVLKKMEEA
jgi:hypothetical protein